MISSLYLTGCLPSLCSNMQGINSSISSTFKTKVDFGWQQSEIQGRRISQTEKKINHTGIYFRTDLHIKRRVFNTGNLGLHVGGARTWALT